MIQGKGAALYCRVSTKAQAEDGTSLDSQEKACRKLAGEKGLTVTNVFKEDWPGDTMDRPLLRQLRDQVKQGAFVAVICHATDRLARKPVHLAIIAEECDKAGSGLFFVTEPLDNSAEGQLIRYVRGYAAEIEREKIRERTMRGKQSRADKGMLPQGTGKGMYGYRYDKETGKRNVADAEVETVRHIFELCANGTSCHAIAMGLNEDNIPAFAGGKWHPRTVSRVLTNQCYKGVTVFGRSKRVSLGGRRYKIIPSDPKEWVEISDATPPIVSEQLWDLAQKTLSQPRRHPTLANRKYLLTGYAQCECGAPLVGSCLNKVRRYYRCRGTWPTSVKPKTCDAPYVRADEAEEQVWKAVESILKNPEVMLEELRRRQGEASILYKESERIQKVLRRLADQERRLVRLYTLGEIDDAFIRKEMAQIKRQRSEADDDLSKLEKQKLQISSLEIVSQQVKEFCAKASARLGAFTFEDKRKALKALQTKVVVGKTGVKLFGVIPGINATIGQTSRSWFHGSSG